MYWERSLPQCHFSTTRSIWKSLGSSPGISGGKPATSRLSHGTVRPRLIKVWHRVVGSCMNNVVGGDVDGSSRGLSDVIS